MFYLSLFYLDISSETFFSEFLLQFFL